MPLAPAQSSQANAPLGHDGLGHQMASTHAHQTFEQQATGTRPTRPGDHVHGGTHDHSVPHTHAPRSSSLRVVVSPVLVSLGVRVLAVLALLGLLWLAIFWAFVGNV